MNKELQYKLIKDFPDLYRQVHLPMDQTCMCWGFDTGDGWYDIIYTLSKNITEIDPDIQAVQVKEKFGGLRFYTGDAKIETADKIYDLINKAEAESLKTCEKCGSKENMKQTEGWIFTLCKPCRKAKRNDPDWRIG